MLNAYSNLQILCFAHRLLVGAPRAVALPRQKANRTGGLYSCDITSRGPCTRVEFDDDGVFFCTCSVFPWPTQPVSHLPFPRGRKEGKKHLFLGRRPLLIAWPLTVSCLPWERLLFFSFFERLLFKSLCLPCFAVSPTLVSKLVWCINVAT